MRKRWVIRGNVQRLVMQCCEIYLTHRWSAWNRRYPLTIILIVYSNKNTHIIKRSCYHYCHSQMGSFWLVCNDNIISYLDLRQLARLISSQKSNPFFSCEVFNHIEQTTDFYVYVWCLVFMYIRKIHARNICITISHKTCTWKSVIKHIYINVRHKICTWTTLDLSNA